MQQCEPAHSFPHSSLSISSVNMSEGGAEIGKNVQPQRPNQWFAPSLPDQHVPPSFFVPAVERARGMNWQ